MERERNFVRKEKSDVIFGIRTVIEAIQAEREINKILIQKGMNKDLFMELKKELADKDYQLQFVPIEKLNALSAGNHQGVIAFLSPIEYGDIQVIVDDMLLKGEKPCILVLDRITDVRNFGAIARTAECQGIDAILIPSKGSALVTADAMKASAGALNRITVCKTDQLKNTLFYLQQSGLRIIACTEKASVPIQSINLRGPMALLFGSEESGITSDLISMSDARLRIPMKGEIASLNVSVAAGIVMYEKMRQEAKVLFKKD
jgi:23S rRNA (guanosine2251-2'-O)-methyltransferase